MVTKDQQSNKNEIFSHNKEPIYQPYYSLNNIFQTDLFTIHIFIHFCNNKLYLHLLACSVFVFPQNINSYQDILVYFSKVFLINIYLKLVSCINLCYN